MGVYHLKLYQLERDYQKEHNQMGIPRLYENVQLDVVALLNVVYRVDEYLRKGQQNRAFGLLWETQVYLKGALRKQLTNQCSTRVRKRRCRTDEGISFSNSMMDTKEAAALATLREMALEEIIWSIKTRASVVGSFNKNLTFA